MRDCNLTVRWRDKYDDYLMDRREKWEKKKRKLHPGIYKHAKYVDPLPAMGLVQEEEPGKCAVCGCETHFRDVATDEYVCCDECKYTLEECRENEEIMGLIGMCNPKQRKSLIEIIKVCLKGWDVI